MRLGLENSSTDQCVDTGAYFEIFFELNVGNRNVEFLDEQLPEICLDLVMAGARRKMRQQFDRPRACQISHPSSALR